MMHPESLSGVPDHAVLWQFNWLSAHIFSMLVNRSIFHFAISTNTTFIAGRLVTLSSTYWVSYSYKAASAGGAENKDAPSDAGSGHTGAFQEALI